MLGKFRQIWQCYYVSAFAFLTSRNFMLFAPFSFEHTLPTARLLTPMDVNCV